MVEITDFESAAAFFESLPKDQLVPVATSLSAREALRALPNIQYENDRVKLALESFRAILITGSVSELFKTAPNVGLQSAALSSSKSTAKIINGLEPQVQNIKNASARSAIVAAYYCALSVYSLHSITSLAAKVSASSSRSIYPNYRKVDMFCAQLDANQYLETPKSSLFQKQLWITTLSSSHLVTAHKDFLAWMADDRKTWGYWHDWYLALYNGEPVDWALATDIALIDDDVWERGAEAVAVEIEKKIRLHNTAVGPNLVEAGDGTHLDIGPPIEVTKTTLDFTIARVESALNKAIKFNAGNGLTETSYETETILEALTHKGDDHSLLATGLYDACISLNQRIGDYYPDDPPTIALQNTLWTTVEEICDGNKVVQTRVGKLAAQIVAELPTAEDKAELQLFATRDIPELTPKAQIQLRADIRRITETEKAPRSVRLRVTNWITTMMYWIDQGIKYEERRKFITSIGKRLWKWWDPTE